MNGTQIKILLLICSCVAIQNSFAQNRMLQLDSAYKTQEQEAGIRIEKFLKNHTSSRVKYRSDGSIMALVDVSPSGVPIYLKSDNAGVATSLGVDELRIGGALGLNLEGSGIKVGIWDEGKVRNDHVEYIGRVTQVDNAPTFNTHSTHVLGTMIASGINPNAKGMAPKATAIAFDFFSDVSEMISQTKPNQTSLILSNHSYGTLSGWDNDGGTWTWFGDPAISQTKDWKFGFYNSTSNLYDDIAFNAPYYLIVKSAGNDNTDAGDGSRPADCNPFDCIPTNGVAKNILTVGAVKKLSGAYTGPSDVILTSFSSLGPTDDGRIKPDIVAPGQTVLSASANSSGAYTPLSGTSMSSPAVTGTLALLQELHKNLNAGNLMKAATLKALVIHTAREAGPSPGPDFKFGWGMLNAEEAAKTLIEKDDQNIFIKELTLNNNEMFEMVLNPKQNTKVTATLVWTDPAGPVLAPTLNPTMRMLKNDLDLRLVDDGGNTKFPWILNSANPAAAATKGDNIVDNIEKLELDDPEPRTYRLIVSHKGSLISGKQNFSLIVNYTSIVDPRISYYWIGNSGNWDNGANWSLSSGGAPVNIVPSANDKVVFDENSFLTDNQTVSLTQDQSCYSIRWFANENIVLSFNSHQLTIEDEVNLLTKNISSSSSGTILFNGTAATDAMVSLNSNNLDDLSLKFSGQNARWTLSGNFQVDKIELVEGTVSINDNSLKLNSLLSTGILSKTLTLSNASITGISSFSMDLSGIILEGEGSSIIAPASSSNVLDLGTNFFTGTIDLQGGEITVNGNGGVDKVMGFGLLNINGSHTWNDFTLNGGSVLRMEESSIQTISKSFLLQATTGNRISVESSGSLMATLDFESHQKICLDNLDVVNVGITGESVVNAGVNSTLINSPQWSQDSCNNILFSDFDIEFNCEEASVFFIDKSSGPITKRTWNFGESGSMQNESDITNPIHFYEAGGQYLVTLDVSNGVNSESHAKEIMLNATTLLENKIELSNGRLISFLPASKYQWVLDGELLTNTNLRSIDFSNGLGVYAVLTFDEECNRRSEPFLVVGVSFVPERSSISVYPNPTNRELFVKTNVHVRNLRLMNNMGQLIIVNRSEIEEGWRIDVSDITAGVYILQIQTDAHISYHRIVVQ